VPEEEEYISFTCKTLTAYNRRYSYNNMDIMASLVLKYSWLKSIDTPLLALA